MEEKRVNQLKLVVRRLHLPVMAIIMLSMSHTVLMAVPLGESLSIANPGFEANSVAPGCFQVFTPTDWSVFDPNGIVDAGNDVVGGLHPAGSPFFPLGAPEGDHVALIFLNGDIGGGPVGLTQVLSDTLEPDTTYTLTVEVGNIASGIGPPPCDVFGFFNLDGFPGYQVQLLAGGVVIAEDDNSLAGTIPEGEFRTSTVQVTIGNTHAQLGELLEVRLINLNMIDEPATPGIEVDFDDVRLTTGCTATGDLNNDGDVDTDDLSILVDVLLENDTDPTHVGRADVDCSGAADGSDIAPFVCILLN